jgi:hypothetical protein
LLKVADSFYQLWLLRFPTAHLLLQFELLLLLLLALSTAA